MTDILIVVIVILAAFVIIQNNRIDRLSNSIRWLLNHVHVVSKDNAKDPELVKIKQQFGIKDE